jgi:nitrogen fixation protein FixH
MMKYQQADMNINEIIKRKALFDHKYSIELVDAKVTTLELENAKRAKSEKVVELSQGNNSFTYNVKDKQGSIVNDANVSFLLTRPHSVSEDHFIENVAIKNGKYVIDNISITKAGRYTLQLKVDMGDTVGYSEIPAYLKP